jgi:hypothetical protein
MITVPTEKGKQMTTELNCKNCGEQSSCWYGQNKEPKKCDSYWNASSVRTYNGKRKDNE